jgi:hypothetical protein
MTLRIASPCTLAVAAALTLGLATTSRAQTTSSQTKIPITKPESSPGEVIPTKVDTVTVYHTDTTRIYSTDTVRLTVPGPTTTVMVTHVDTVTIQPLMVPPRMTGGFYMGLGASDMLPWGSIRYPNGDGPGAQLNIGWQGLKNFLGVRFDEDFVRYGVSGDYVGLAPHPDVWNSDLDLKAQIPYLTHLFGYAPRFTVYAIGGGTYARYENLRVSLNSDETGIGAQNVGLADGTWRGNWGYNVGGGVAFHWRSTEIFAESRVISFNTSVSPAVRQISPLTLGMNLF